VASAEQARLAVAVAREAPQVDAVKDELKVRSGASTPDRVEAVKRALARNAHLSAYRIGVRERNGRLLLEGRVHTGAEKDLAGLLARDAFGDTIDNGLVVRP
jgi:osmotically-inducible protein OsmY